MKKSKSTHQSSSHQASLFKNVLESCFMYESIIKNSKIQYHMPYLDQIYLSIESGQLTYYILITLIFLWDEYFFKHFWRWVFSELFVKKIKYVNFVWKKKYCTIKSYIILTGTNVQFAYRCFYGWRWSMILDIGKKLSICMLNLSRT